MKNIDFRNLPQLCCSKMRIGSADASDIVYYLNNADDYGWDYLHVIVDEGQDFSDAEIEALYDLAVLHSGVFYVFYDKNQFVQGSSFYGEAGSSEAYSPKWLGRMECRLVLHRNCRNTYQIAETSGRPLGIEPGHKEVSVAGDVPRFHICSSERLLFERVSALVDKYRNDARYEYSQICILTMRTESDSVLSGLAKIGNHKLASERRSDGVFFTTAKKFKGLESDVVIIIDVDEKTFEDVEDRRIFYVAASRAKNFLDIAFLGEEERLGQVTQRISKKH